MISLMQGPLYARTHHLLKRDIHVSVGFEPAFPASERPQTHALDRVGAVMGCENNTLVLLTVRKSQLSFLLH
jgi:hypothetical protein